MFDKVEYEYYAIIDGQEIKVDDCFSNLHGTSYCEIDDYTYFDVPYRSVEINRIENYYGFYLSAFMIIGLVIAFMSAIFSK